MARDVVLCGRCVQTKRIHCLVACPKHCDNLPRKLHLEDAGPQATYNESGQNPTRGAFSMLLRAKFRCHIRYYICCFIFGICLSHDSGVELRLHPDPSGFHQYDCRFLQHCMWFQGVGIRIIIIPTFGNSCLVVAWYS